LVRERKKEGKRRTDEVEMDQGRERGGGGTKRQWTGFKGITAFQRE
jgi:hypothetical protein